MTTVLTFQDGALVATTNVDDGTPAPEWEVRNRAGQQVVALRPDGSDKSNTLELSAPEPETRAGITFWDRPAGVPDRELMLVISCHGPEDVYSDGGGTIPGDHHHVTFYSPAPGVENNKVMEWHWGPGWDGWVRFFTSILTLGTVEALSSSDADKSVRVRRQGEANERWSVRGNGTHWFGSGGNTSPDVYLQRAGAARLATNGDVELVDATKGVILRSPNGARWRLTVNDLGAVTTTKL